MEDQHQVRDLIDHYRRAAGETVSAQAGFVLDVPNYLKSGRFKRGERRISEGETIFERAIVLVNGRIERSEDSSNIALTAWALSSAPMLASTDLEHNEGPRDDYQIDVLGRGSMKLRSHSQCS